ncbi:MAG: multicopper oxidase domain-containing protein, partial [bacterium]
MKRREFIKYGTAGIVTLAVGRYALMPTRKAYGGTIDLDLTIEAVDVEMVDGTTVFMWAYNDVNNGGPRVPGPVIEAVEGDRIRCRITNNSAENHGFAIHGMPPPIIDIGVITPGQTKLIEFDVPRAGTYMYLDPLNAPVNRVLGLHGALVVLPSDPSEVTPYSNPTSRVTKLFEDLGDASKGFPGIGWDDKRVYPNGRSWVWVFNEIDPKWNERADRGDVINPTAFVAGFLPRYFTLNGDSGWFIAHNLNTSPRGKEGEPAVLRTMMAGLGTRPPHIHGNHVYLISKVNSSGVNEPQDNVIELDTWTVKPLKCIDVLLPFRRPPDVPQGLWPPKEEGFPLTWPIHPHDEISTTAAGGMYPQGIMNDWHITEPTTADPGNDGSFTNTPHDISFEQFGCKPLEISPSTPDKLPKSEVDVFIKREFFGNRDIRMPDGKKVRFWGFEDPDDRSTRGSIPAPLIRVREGQKIHCELKVKKGSHTIHWHGIEPTSFNDGVPHNSFEVESRYTYQWQAAQAGTFFYHCHKNTVLHFQMGMSGLLIVDPPDGPGKLCSDPASRYDVEVAWAIADVDPDWRDLPGGHNAGMCGEDVGLNNFNPKYFMINGVPHPNTMTDPKVVARAKPDDIILFRLLNACYCIALIEFPFDVEVIEIDGRPLFPSSTGGSHSNHGYAHPFAINSGDPIEMETAQRTGCLAKNLAPGEYTVRVEYRDLIRPSELEGVAEALVIISDQPDTPPGDDVITVSRARYEHNKGRWNIKGKTSVDGPGNAVTIYLGSDLTGTVIGTDEVSKSGKWKFKEVSSIVPDASKTLSFASSKGGVLLAVPVEETGTPSSGDVGPDTLTTTKVSFKHGKDRWKVYGKSTFKGSGHTVTIHLGPTLSGPVIGTKALKKGKWKFKKSHSSVIPSAGDTVSIESSKGGVLLAVPVAISGTPSGGGGGGGGAGPDTLTTTKVSFKHGRDRWKVYGKSTFKGSGHTVTIHLGPTLSGPVIGTKALKKGKWKFKKSHSSVIPSAGDTVSIESSKGGVLLAVPVAISGTPSGGGGGGGGGPDTLSLTKVDFKQKKRQWKVYGRSSFKGSGNIVTIHLGPTLSGPVIGTKTVKKGKWKFKKSNSTVIP